MPVYHEKLQAIRSKFHKDVEDLARQFRSVIVELCEKYHLRFISANGVFFFTDGKRDYACAADCVQFDMKEAFRTLDEPVDGDLTLGHYVDSFPSQH